MRHAIAALLALTLAACDGAGDADAPGGVTPGEAEVLNQAAEMLDANAVAPEAVDIEPENAR